jgi:Icc-related predicted phosphoesterase
MKKITCISDTHSLHTKMKHHIGEGDILIHAGDLTNVGKDYEVEEVIAWFHRTLEYFDDVVFIAGNHDRSFDRCFIGGGINYHRLYSTDQEASKKAATKPQWLISLLESMDNRIHYLENNSEKIQGLLFHGSPATPNFFREYWAFNYERGDDISSCWGAIPKDVDVLITHGPAFGILDTLEGSNQHVGCEELEYKIKYELEDLKLHVCGHIHNPRGIVTSKYGDPIFVNAAICTESYEPINAPIQVRI